MKVDINFKLDVLANGVDAVRRLIFAQEILFAAFKKPKMEDKVKG